MFHGMNDTDFHVHTCRLQEQLIKSERYHQLTRTNQPVGRRREPVRALVSRLLSRPIRVSQPEPVRQLQQVG